ncbi:MAG: phosphoribosyltransferase [Campylobacterota bacterium]
MHKYYYGYDEFKNDVKELEKKVASFGADTFVAVARGGLTLGHFLAHNLDTRRLYTINSIHYEKEKKLDSFDIFNIPNLKDAKKVLLLDDIVDSGETMEELLQVLGAKYPGIEFKLATIFYKPAAKVQPDFALKQAYEWIDFFWEVDTAR